MIRTYSELTRLKTFEERFEYLSLKGHVGEETFGFDRYLNQVLYTSGRWRKIRDVIIVRDYGCDLAMKGYEIYGRLIVHHMNPITIEDVELDRDIVYDTRFLISVTHNTHLAIHFGDKSLLPKLPTARCKNDTIPWLN